MEHAISAVASELVSRLISFLTNKYHPQTQPDEEDKAEKLQRLLTRVGTVVEEADGRYITNSGMLTQLRMLSDAMYRGHRALDASRYRTLALNDGQLIDSSSSTTSLRLATLLSKKRPRTAAATRKDKASMHPLHDLHGAVASLETAAANMTEFVMLLAGYERMSCRRPYDAYLYIDNFMFGRHAEKQKLLNFLLQHDPPGEQSGDAPAVLPIIGGVAVGKKTLVAHVCRDDRVRSRFTSILHLDRGSFPFPKRVLDLQQRERTEPGTTLLVVELGSDAVDGEGWAKFCSYVATMGKAGSCNGCKVIILSRLKSSEKLGTVRPILLNGLSHDEFSYLFKALAFGSADQAEHPRLAQIADEFVEDLQVGWSLVPANAFADVMRANPSVQVWLSVLSRYRRVIRRTLSVYGVHPNQLFEQGHPVDIADFVPHPAASRPRPLRVKHCAEGGTRSTMDAQSNDELPRVEFVRLLLDPGVRPQGDFNLVSWESRLPPYTSLVHFVPSCAPDEPEASSGRKRRGVPIDLIV